MHVRNEADALDWIEPDRLRTCGLSWPHPDLPESWLHRDRDGRVCLGLTIRHLTELWQRSLRERSSAALQLSAAEPSSFPPPPSHIHRALRMARFLSQSIECQRNFAPPDPEDRRSTRQSADTGQESNMLATSQFGFYLQGQIGRVQFVGFDEANDVNGPNEPNEATEATRVRSERQARGDDARPPSLLAFANADDYLARWDLEARELCQLPWRQPATLRGQTPQIDALHCSEDGLCTVVFGQPSRGYALASWTTDEGPELVRDPWGGYGPSSRQGDVGSEDRGRFRSLAASRCGSWLAVLSDCKPSENDGRGGIIELFPGVRTRATNAESRPASRVELARLAEEDARYESLMTIDHDLPVLASAIEPSGRQLVVCQNDQLALWRLDRLHDALDEDSAPATTTPSLANAPSDPEVGRLPEGVRVHARAQWIVEESDDLLPTGPSWSTPLKGYAPTGAIAFCPTGRRIALGLVSGRCLVLDSTNGSILAVADVGDGDSPVTHCAFHPERAVLCASTARGEVQLFDHDTARPIWRWQLAGGEVTSLGFERRGTRIAVGMASGRIWVGHMPDLERLRSKPS